MEADLFQDIFSALEQHNKRIRLPLNNACPIQKIVWSSFDYLRGPELEFVWEADYLRPDNAGGAGVSQQFLSPKSQLNDTTNGAHSDNEAADACTDSTDSSFSKNTGESAASTTQYEEIDEYFNSELLQLSGEPFNANLLCDASMLRSANRLFASSSTEDAAGQHQQLMTDELSSLNLSYQTDDTLRPVPNNRTPAPSKTAGEEEEAGVLVVTESFLVDANPSEAMVTSCVDSGIGGTISIESNLSTYAKPELREEVVFNSDDQRCNIRMRKSDIAGYHIPEAEEVIDFKKAYVATQISHGIGVPRTGTAHFFHPFPRLFVERRWTRPVEQMRTREDSRGAVA
uniref:Uncharacterized protein n=1 Tax=Globodera rostochiensis TaxID=31243 RepID=A0A914H5M9_GLORO